MHSIIYTGRFRKDLKLLKKQGANLEFLREVLLVLQAGKMLEPRYEDPPLHGKLEGKRDCHITSDWVLIYAVDQDSLTLYRTGTHAEIFR